MADVEFLPAWYSRRLRMRRRLRLGAACAIGLTALSGAGAWLDHREAPPSPAAAVVASPEQSGPAVVPASLARTID